MVNLPIIQDDIYPGYTLCYLPHNVGFLNIVVFWPEFFPLRAIYLMMIPSTHLTLQWFLIVFSIFSSYRLMHVPFFNMLELLLRLAHVG